MGTFGVDVSAYQAGKLIPNDVGFVFAKCTEGTEFRDLTYDAWASSAEKAGAQFGAYHFFHAEDLNARAQAGWFVENARVRTGLSLWVDYETYGKSGQADAEEIGLFINSVKQFTGKPVKVGLYANDYGYSRIKPYLHEIPFNGYWRAHPSAAGINAITYEDLIIQYATVDGIDRNYTRWTEQEMADYWKW